MNSVPQSFLRRVAVALAAALLTLLTGGAWFYRSQEQSIRRAASEQLESVGRIKADLIVGWRAERLGDAAILQESPFFAQGVARFLADPSDENSRPLLTQFRSLQVHYHYADVVLVDPAGRMRLSLSGEAGTDEECAGALVAALRGRKPVLTELHNGGALPGAACRRGCSSLWRRPTRIAARCRHPGHRRLPVSVSPDPDMAHPEQDR